MENKQQATLRYRFRRDQVVTGDVREFLDQYDPFRLQNRNVAGLFGGVVLDFEGTKPAEVPSHTQIRALLRRLHAIWPWSGFFLRLDQPLGPAVGVNRIPLLALGLCVTDFNLLVRPAQREARLQINGPQLRKFRYIAHVVVERLGKRAGLPPAVIKTRHDSVAQQFHLVLQ